MKQRWYKVVFRTGLEARRLSDDARGAVGEIRNTGYTIIDVQRVVVCKTGEVVPEEFWR